MIESDSFIVSLSDIWQRLKKSTHLLILIAMAIGFIFFLRQLSKPLTYSIEALFQSEKPIQNQELTLAKLQSMIGNDSDSLLKSNTKPLLDAYPVIQLVVKKLDLQASLKMNSPSLFQTMWRNFVLERAYFRFRYKKRPKVPFLSKEIVTPDTPFFAKKELPLECKSVFYPETYYSVFKLSFIDDENFKVYKKGKNVGKGSLNSEFVYDKIRFRLSGSPKALKGRSFTLTLIPEFSAVASLQKKIAIKAEKTNSLLYKIKYKHGQKEQGLAIVDELMQCYREFLLEQSKEKIKTQLAFLELQKKQMFEEFQKQASRYRDFLSETLTNRGFLTATSEVNYVSTKLIEAHQRLLQITTEMKELKELPFQELKKVTSIEEEGSSFEVLKKLRASYEQELDKSNLKSKSYDFCLEKLAEDCELANITKLIDDPPLLSHIEKIQDLYFKLSDPKNWSQKEKEWMREELTIEKEFLKTSLSHARQGLLQHDSVLKEKIGEIKLKIVAKLIKEYESIQKEISELSPSLKALPEKWLEEQNFEFERKVRGDLLTSLSETVEAKNLSLHLQNLNSFPVQKATAQLLPNPPHLLVTFLIASLAAFFLTTLLIALLEISKGASASAKNLKAIGYDFVGALSSDIPELIYCLSKSKKMSQLILISSKQRFSKLPFFLSHFSESKSLLISLHAKQGEKGLFDYLSDETLSLPIHTQSSYDWMASGKKTHAYASQLASHKFRRLLNSLKTTYEWIFIEHQGFPLSFETKLLTQFADHTIYLVSNERLSELSKLPNETLFLVDDKKITLRSSHLNGLIDKLKARTIT